MGARADGALLIRDVDLYAPEHVGARDVLVVGGRVAAIGERLPLPGDWLPCEVLELPGRMLFPGFVDGHVHILGGGGEGGPATRAPEVELEALLSGGTTSVVGLLGFDGVTRSLVSLLAKARALSARGLKTWIYTGSYQVPPATITGDVERDIVLIGEVVGVGEIALADQRASQAEPGEIVRLAARARIAGLLAGKAGLVLLHMGDAASGLAPLEEALARSDLPASQFYPTHVNRRRPLLLAAARFARRGGGPVDVTASCTPELGEPEAVPPHEALRVLVESGVDPRRITMSSDGNGSLPTFDESSRVVATGVGSVRILWEKLRLAIERSGLPVPMLLAMAGRNVASVLRLPGKGEIAPGMDADMVVVNRELEIEKVILGGRLWEPRGGRGRDYARSSEGAAPAAMRAASRPLGQIAW